MQFKPNNDGFTLIEMLIVVAVAGCVGAIFLPIIIEKFWPLVRPFLMG